jgi:hypothetical protein
MVWNQLVIDTQWIKITKQVYLMSDTSEADLCLGVETLAMCLHVGSTDSWDYTWNNLSMVSKSCLTSYTTT